MRDYCIVTDSTCDLPANIVTDLGITVIPMEFQLDGTTYLNYPDGRDYDFHAFYDALRAGKASTTSQVNYQTFLDTFTPILESGRDILYLAFSSGLSGTYNGSVIAANDLMEKYPGSKVISVDTLAASVGEGLLVYTAAKKREEGLSLDELAQWVTDNRLHLCHWFTVDDLNHLKRGGRVSAATALFGTMLSIKPVMYTSPEGKLIPMGKARGMKAALTELVNTMDKLAIRPIREPVFICHADCQDSVDYVKGLLYERFGVTDVRADYIGPVIGSHTGCGTLGLFFMGTER